MVINKLLLLGPADPISNAERNENDFQMGGI